MPVQASKPHQHDEWQRFALEIGGHCYQTHRASWTSPAQYTVLASTGEWVVAIDSYARLGRRHTRITSIFVSHDGFAFSIKKKGMRPGRRGRGNDNADASEFHQHFRVDTNDPDKLQSLLSANDLARYLMSHHGKFRNLQIRTHDPSGFVRSSWPAQLQIEVDGIIRSKDKLMDLYELSGLLLEGLGEIGSAGPANS